MRHLSNDRTAIESARKKARETYTTMTPGPQLEQKLLNAALEKIEKRKAQGKHVSSHFAVFKNYVPPQAYGKGSKEDTDKDRLIEEYFDGLYGRRRPAQLEESDDEEEMPLSLKKQEGEQPQELGSIPAYVPERKTRPTGHCEAAQQQMNNKGAIGKLPKSHAARPPTRRTTRNITTITNKDSENEDESEAEPESDLGYDSDDGSDSEDAEDAKEQGKKRKVIFPMVAARRGLALLKEAPTNGIPTVKHRFSTIVVGGRKAVLRGRIANEDDEAPDGEWTWVEKKGWSLVGKRACEDEADVGDSIEVAFKKAKVEAAS
jgi:hypothetical protein